MIGEAVYFKTVEAKSERALPALNVHAQLSDYIVAAAEPLHKASKRRAIAAAKRAAKQEKQPTHIKSAFSAQE